MTTNRRAQVERKVQAYLEDNSYHFIHRSGVLFLRFGSASVSVEISEVGSQLVLLLRSTVVSDLDESSDRLTVLDEINSLNLRTSFGRWVLSSEDGLYICLEYELLADHLQEAELMTALSSVARFADRYDGPLQAKFGGRRAYD